MVVGYAALTHPTGSEIASDYRINQGRIADLKFGRIFPDVEPADISDCKV
jgi:hypothetical protein